MKKIVMSVAFFFVATLCINANAQTSISSLEIQKFQRPAMFFEAIGSAGDIEDAIIAYMKTKGFKKDKIKGDIIKFTNVRIDKVPATLDYFFKIESKGKKKDNLSSIWFATSSGVDVFTDTAKVDNWKYMNDFVNHIKTVIVPYYGLDNNVSAKMKEIKSSKDDLDDLKKKKQKLETEVEETGKKIDDTNKKIDQQQKELADLNAQKETMQKNL